MQARKNCFSQLLSLLAIILLAAFAGGGCKGETAAKPVKIGVILPLSGDLAAFGKSTIDGIQLRVTEANASGGVNGRQVSLLIEDNHGNSDQTISAHKKLTGLKGVCAVIGPITSTNTLAVSNDVTVSRTPTLSPTATNDKVGPASEFLFRACFKDSFQGQIVANYAYKDLGIRKAAVLIDKSSDYSIGLTGSFHKAFTALGGEVVASESYQQKDTEYGPQLTKIKASGAKLVFVPGYPGEVPLILRQAKVMGLEATFSGGDGWDHPDIISHSGDKIVGGFLVGAFSKEDSRPAVQQFVKAIEQSTGAEAGSFEALGYDSVTLLLEAMKTGVERDQIRQGLLGLKNIETVTGSTTITPVGDAEKSAVVLGVEKQGDAYVKKYLKTVSP